jgi:rod shape-determining protein MreD
VTLYLVVPLLLLIAVVQTSAMPHLRLWGVFPDLPLIVVVSWGLLRGAKEGLVWGLIAGVCVDLLSGAPAGAATVSLGAVGLLAGLTQRTPLRAQLLLPVVVMLAATLVYGIFFLVALQVSSRPVIWGETLVRVILPLSALNLLVLPVVYWPLRSIHRRLGREAMEW